MHLHDDGILEIDEKYTVGTNDGREFRHVTFKGYKLLNGKPMMVFKTDYNKQLSVNPSYYSFTLKEDRIEEPRFIDKK
tara:strand:- start:181 stop:414 length:234 start_codon:yes stop_codon:yes gene_type:complete